MSEERTVSATGGEKGVKMARYDLIPVDALRQVAEHYGKGAEKYADHNWRRGYEWSKSYAALQRHANLFWSGETHDPENGSHHMAAVAFHALALITFTAEHPGYDDRYEAREAGEVAGEGVLVGRRVRVVHHPFRGDGKVIRLPALGDEFWVTWDYEDGDIAGGAGEEFCVHHSCVEVVD